jgi:hypothetical protein
MNSIQNLDKKMLELDLELKWTISLQDDTKWRPKK